MKYYRKIENTYVTRGVADNVDQYHVNMLFGIIEQLRNQSIEPDYLQVFELIYEDSGNQMIINHSQEEPPFSQTVSYSLPPDVQPYTGRIWIIDDIDHITALFPEEY